MVRATAVKANKMKNKGMINFNHLSNPNFTLASDARINPVGLIKKNNPDPYI